MSSTTTGADTSTSAQQSTNYPFPTGGTGGGGNNGNTGQNGTLYLFTFLITIIVLALISGALLFRAYYVRRRFQRRVEEAIRNGRPLPTDAAIALGLMRPGRPGKKEKKLGPMPMIWETEMLIDKEKDEERDFGRDRIGAASTWAGITPVSVVHYPDGPAPPLDDGPEFEPSSLPPDLFAPAPQRYPMLPQWLPQPRHPRRPVLDRQLSKPIAKREPAYTVPEKGAEVEVAVVIAMPCEQGQGTEGRDRYWTREVDEEREVPDVVLGMLRGRLD